MSMRKCRLKSCRSELPPVKQCETIVQRKGFCDIPCLSDYGKEKSRQSRERTQRKEIRKARERIKTRSEWLRDAQTAVNSYIRERDKGRPCVSCDKPDDGSHQRHASHYRSVGACSALRFNTRNIFASCAQCNSHRSGNILEYRIRLTRRFGPEWVEWLESQNQPTRYEIEYLKRLKRVFNKRAKHIKKLRDIIIQTNRRSDTWHTVGQTCRWMSS